MRLFYRRIEGTAIDLDILFSIVAISKFRITPMKAKRFETIGVLVEVIKEDFNFQKNLLLEEVCKFQFRAEPVCHDWPVNAETILTLINAVLLRASERAKTSSDLGFGTPKCWDTAGSEVVADIRRLTQVS